VQEIVGPFSPQFPDVEATLDTQYITATGLGADNWYWTSNGWMYTFTQNLFNHSSVPTVVSMSWGWSEAQQCSSGIDQGECQTLGVDNAQYVQRVNTEFQKVGLRGVSVFASSGDSGANGRSDPTCTDKKLHPAFPAASPFVTAVGATQMETVTKYLESPVCKAQQMQCAAAGTEEAVSAEGAGFTSGGGFSDLAAQPAYQKDAVEEFLRTSTLPPSGFFNPTGRAFPDVAANGNNYLVYIDLEGGWQPVGGTSASSPTWAGLAARLNDLSLAKTGKPLGLLNPLLYQAAKEHPQAFNDIVKGDNKCTEGGCAPGCQGFVAGKGWDAVSGLGTPNYAELAKYVESVLEKKQSLVV
jgi:tripeptidyl-peptidase-1